MPIIEGTFVDAVGDACIGLVTFRPSSLRESLISAGGILTPQKVTIPLDSFGALQVELESGDYDVAIVLQGSRTIYTTITIPTGAGTLNLRDLLQAYMPTPSMGAAVFSDPGEIEFAIPYSSTHIDYVLLGAGGGGDVGTFITVGPGGLCGEWLTGTLERGEDIPFSTQALSGVVGAGVVGVDGEDTTLSGAGLGATLVADGGAHGANTGLILGTPVPISYGQGVTPVTLNGFPYEGGAVQTVWGADGFDPGGGGSGGFNDGTRGGHGRIWLRAY